MADTFYTWRGIWQSGLTYKVNDQIEHEGFGYICLIGHLSSLPSKPGDAGLNAVWGQYWEKIMDKLYYEVDEKTVREDPFHYIETKGIGKPTYHVCIDEGNDAALVVFGDLEEMLEARKLTNRLNNAVYRWLVKKGA